MNHATEGMPTVLLVDDSVEVHRLVNMLLRHEGICLMPALTGAEGLQMARAEPPSAILLDLDMPELDGFEVLRALKQDAKTMHVPVLILAGSSDVSDKVTAFDLGASDYIVKPPEPSELCARVRAAVRLDQLLRLLAERAEIDGLTGLSNRAAFTKRLAQEAAESRRYASAITLAMIDADHFKRINDTFGHPAGDAVLQRIARIISAQCRGTDIACRYGGEEFAVIMPRTGPADARMVGERIRSAVEAAQWPRSGGSRITVSVGMCGSESGLDLEPERLIDAADKNLYAAKAGGRNRVVSSPLGGTPANEQSPPLAKSA